MSRYLRLIAVVLSLMVFAAVFTVCGVAVACTCSEDACCEQAERTDRLRDDAARIVKAIGYSLTRTSLVACVMDLSTPGVPSDTETPIPLAGKVSRLRV